LICGTRDRTIPCRHAEDIFQSARGPKELWVVEGAEHASALGRAPAEYENRVIRFLTKAFSKSGFLRFSNNASDSFTGFK
jgi:fermentation-respiration switch protein FrsA (DUF1100 family)